MVILVTFVAMLGMYGIAARNFISTSMVKNTQAIGSCRLMIVFSKSFFLTEHKALINNHHILIVSSQWNMTSLAIHHQSAPTGRLKLRNWIREQDMRDYFVAGGWFSGCQCATI